MTHELTIKWLLSNGWACMVACWDFGEILPYDWACLDAQCDDYVLYSMSSCCDLFCVISILPVNRVSVAKHDVSIMCWDGRAYYKFMCWVVEHATYFMCWVICWTCCVIHVLGLFFRTCCVTHVMGYIALYDVLVHVFGVLWILFNSYSTHLKLGA